jgi:hypothetical protein
MNQMSPNMMNQMPYQENMGSQAMDMSHKQKMYDFCRQHMYHYVQMETADGSQYDGIVDGMDNDQVYLLAPIGDMNDDENQRQFGGFGGFGGPFGGFGGPFGGFGGFGFPFRFRRFGRFGFPFSGIRRFSFPFFF